MTGKASCTTSRQYKGRDPVGSRRSRGSRRKGSENLQSTPRVAVVIPRQLSVLLFLYGYVLKPPRESDVEAALAFALEDCEGVA